MEAKIIKHNPEDVHAPAGGYAHVARYKDLIFISGQFGFDREGNLAPDAKSQAMQAFKNVELCLKSQGATLDDIIKVTMYVSGLENKMAVIEARDHFLKHNYPASSLVFTELAHDYLVEVEVVAAAR